MDVEGNGTQQEQNDSDFFVHRFITAIFSLPLALFFKMKSVMKRSKEGYYDQGGTFDKILWRCYGAE
jgi:hypothetical protein